MILLGIVFYIISVFIYFFPSYVAYKRNKHNKIFIYLVNFFGGWFIIGWILALILATRKDDRDQIAVNKRI
ncbi:superinfection immunity protein [Virgibacillus sp. MG-45]|uniref:superinfection immunity protein n=1 Tax=Virgibacillus sp. MG-45 TaxID=3102791 RepID=UPI002ED9D19F